MAVGGHTYYVYLTQVISPYHLLTPNNSQGQMYYSVELVQV